MSFGFDTQPIPASFFRTSNQFVHILEITMSFVVEELIALTSKQQKLDAENKAKMADLQVSYKVPHIQSNLLRLKNEN